MEKLHFIAYCAYDMKYHTIYAQYDMKISFVTVLDSFSLYQIRKCMDILE